MDYVPHVRSKRRKVHRTFTAVAVAVPVPAPAPTYPRTRRGKNGVGTGELMPRDAPATTASICSAYSEEGYDSMNLDMVRNNFFRKAIRSAAAAYPGAQWLEVGCGASALLTRMVLDADPHCTIVAFEINPAAAALARRRLKQSVNYEGRWSIVDGDVKQHRGILPSAQVLLFEIFGFIASSEGVAETIADVLSKLPSTPDVCIPSVASTFIAPVELTDSSFDQDPSLYVGNGLLLTRRFNFERDMVSTYTGLFEHFNFTLGDMHQSLQQRHNCSFSFIRDADLHGFGLFIVLGAKGFSTCRDNRSYPEPRFHVRQDMLWVSSNLSEEVYCSNWRNLIVLFDSTLSVKRGGIIHIQVTSHLQSNRPAYVIDCEVQPSAEDVQTYSVSRILTFDDLYPSYVET